MLTGFEVAAVHTIHIGGRSSKVRDVTFEIGHGNYLLGLSQNAFFRAANDKLALMGRDGAEGATAEASPVDVDGELDHLVGRNRLPLIFGMRQTGVGQIVGCIQPLLW